MVSLKGKFGAAGKFFGGVWAWVLGPVGKLVVGGLLALALVWWVTDEIGDRREAKCNAAWVIKLSEAEEKIRKLTEERDGYASKIAEETRAEDGAVTNEVTKSTQEAVTKIRYIYRNVAVPANCPVELPPEVSDVLDEAISRANKVGE